MTKVIERNVAEIIIIVLTPLIILLTMLLFCTSCSSNKCIYEKDWKKSNESRR